MISRREFLCGVGVVAGSALLPSVGEGFQGPADHQRWVAAEVVLTVDADEVKLERATTLVGDDYQCSSSLLRITEYGEVYVRGCFVYDRLLQGTYRYSMFLERGEIWTEVKSAERNIVLGPLLTWGAKARGFELEEAWVKT